MSKEAIELLEEAKIHIAMIQTNSRKPELIGERTTILVGEKYKTNGGILDKALALLRAEEPKCKTCGDTGKARVICRSHDEEIPQYVPCKDCKPEEPPQGEFTKATRRAMIEFLNIYGEKSEIFPPIGAEHVIELCDIIDHQAAEIKTKGELLEWAWVDCGSQKDFDDYIEYLEEMNKPSEVRGKDAEIKDKS